MLRLFFIRLILKVLYIFKINNRKIFFSSYEGATLSCNPKYIYLEMVKRYGDNLIYVWEINNGDSFSSNYPNVIFVKHNSLNYIFHVMTSKVLISNVGITSAFPLRKKQFSINTWHGAGCYKKEGVNLSKTDLKKYRKERFLAEKNVQFYLSGAQAWTDVFSKAVLSDPKKFLPVGCPRNDMLINGISSEAEQTIKNKIGIKTKVVLYAPTYRGERDTPEQAACPLDVNKLLQTLEKKFGGDWTFAYRCHYATASQFQNLSNAIDLSNYDDMQELLAISDVLISDYSSTVWDFSFTYKPCFLYCYDLDTYLAERDLYLPIWDWHFPVSKSMDDLINQIENFDENDFIIGMKKHHDELGSFEKGTATDFAVNLISKQMKN